MKEEARGEPALILRPRNNLVFPLLLSICHMATAAIPEFVPPGVVHETPRDWLVLRQELQKTMPKVNAGAYYAWYHGHEVEHLVRTREILQERGCDSFIYMLGDSTLDNKHWFFDLAKSKEEQVKDPNFAATAACVNGYEHVLEPPIMVKDVNYWLNLGMQTRLKSPGKICTLMTSVEESTLADRKKTLLEQDGFVRDHITKNDYLIVSVGGNDVALAPTIRTIFNMFLLTRSPDWMIRKRIAPGFSYFVKLFGSKVASLIDKVCAKQKPKKILLCMLYYLDENPANGWADDTLKKLGYDSNPAKLQLIIETLFHAIREQQIGSQLAEEGTTVHHMPLFTVLNPSDSSNYVERVEPSVEGGKKMADALLEVLLADDSEAAIDNLLDHPPAFGGVTLELKE